MNHLKIAKDEIKAFKDQPAREHLEVAKVHAMITIGEGLLELLNYLKAFKVPDNGKDVKSN